RASNNLALHVELSSICKASLDDRGVKGEIMIAVGHWLCKYMVREVVLWHWQKLIALRLNFRDYLGRLRTGDSSVSVGHWILLGSHKLRLASINFVHVSSFIEYGVRPFVGWGTIVGGVGVRKAYQSKPFTHYESLAYPCTQGKPSSVEDCFVRETYAIDQVLGLQLRKVSGCLIGSSKFAHGPRVKLVGMWGSFVSLDRATSTKSCFDVARVLISTAFPEPISESLPVVVEGSKFTVTVFEESLGETMFSRGIFVEGSEIQAAPT
ncbi:hypothetical protein Ancab_010607, partial [Ancistrocladus abbreviatus]